MIAVLLISILCAQDFKAGERIQIILKNGNALTGTITQPQRDIGKKEDFLTIDLSREYLRLNGAISIPKSQIKEIKKLKTYDEETLKKLKKLKEDELKKIDEEIKKREEKISQIRKEEEEQIKKKEEESEQAGLEKEKQVEKEQQEKLLKGIELLKEFPPEKGWDEARYETLKANLIPTGEEKPKYYDLRKRVFTEQPYIEVPADEEEEKFFDNYELWKLAKDYLKEQPQK